MTRTMQDSVTAGALMPGANFYAGYVDGRYANVSAIQKRFPRTRVIRITVLGTNAADVVDIETGDCTPASGVASIKRGTAHTGYCNLSTLGAVLRQIDAQKLPRSTPIWTAHYTGRPHLCSASCFAGLGLPWQPHVVATQYADHGAHGENVDLSLVAAYWPGIDPASKPAVAPTFTFRRTLRLGMVGTDVTALKRRLKAIGYGGTVPGPIFGRGLQAVLRTFQKDHHLTVDGVCGPITAAAVNK